MTDSCSIDNNSSSSLKIFSRSRPTGTPSAIDEIGPDTMLEKIKAKQEWVKQMRLSFSVRPGVEATKNIVFEDGTLNQDYFRPPKPIKQEDPRKWTDKEKDILIQGIQKHGIGNFAKISDEFLPKWTANELRVKTIRLIGRQNLQIYKDQCWKGGAEDIANEYDRNKAIGLKFGQWKQGVLVYDDDGLALAEILKTESRSNGKMRVNDSVEEHEEEEEEVEEEEEEEEEEEDKDMNIDEDEEERKGIQNPKKRRK